MKIKPQYGVVLCKQLNKQHEDVVENNFAYSKENLPVYEILETGIMPDNSRFKAGDKIISNSTPTKIILENQDYYLVKYEYIAGKIEA